MQRKRKGFNFLKPLFFIIFLLSIFCSGYIYTSTRANTEETNLKEVTNTDNKELNDLEEKIFHQNFKTEQTESRLSRLENFLFGKSYEKEIYENRIKKISTALKTPEVEKPAPTASTEGIKPESLVSPPQDATNKEGIIGAINQIEMKMFNMTYNDYPFPARISALEDRLLSKNELAKNRTKPLLERVTILVNKAGILNQPAPPQPSAPNPQSPTQSNNTPKSYSVNPNTGLLINEQTGETVRDPDGNPISVMLPQALPQQNYGYIPQQNPLYQNPYGNQFQQNPGGIPSPYDFLFNQQNNLDPGGSDPGY